MKGTMRSPDSGEMLIRDMRPFEVKFRDWSTVVELPGYYPVGEGESIHVGDDLEVANQAFLALKSEVLKEVSMHEPGPDRHVVVADRSNVAEAPLTDPSPARKQVSRGPTAGKSRRG